MTYEDQLANALRDRGADETEVAEAVTEVRRHLAESGGRPQDRADQLAEAEFGTAEAYAAALHPQAASKVRSPGRTVTVVGVLIAVAYVVAAFAARAISGFDVRSVIGPVILWPAVVITAIAIIVGIVVDRRRKAPAATGSSR